MSPLSSTHPASDTGCVYFINPVDRSFKIVDAASGEALESFKDVEWEYKAFTEEEWANWFELDIGVPNIRSYANKRAFRRISPARYGWGPWPMRMGGKYVLSVHALTPRNSGRLSLKNVLSFSELGDSLTFDHLRPYAYSDIGSGLYICVFPINDKRRSWLFVW